MSFKDLGKKLHDAVLTSDGEEAKATTPTTTPTPATKIPFDFSKLSGAGAQPSPAFTPATTAPSPFAVPGTTVLDEAVYKRVFDKTNFDSTPVGIAVHKYFDALEGTGLDTNTRFKSAILQAAKLEGITPDQVLATFDTLKTALQTESDKFSRAVDAQTQKEVVARQNQLQTIAQQIADLQAQQTKVTGELADAQTKVSNAVTQMQLATTRRAQEIDQQKAQFAGLLR